MENVKSYFGNYLELKVVKLLKLKLKLNEDKNES